MSDSDKNTLAYYKAELITSVKGFIVEPRGLNDKGNHWE